MKKRWKWLFVLGVVGFCLLAFLNLFLIQMRVEDFRKKDLTARRTVKPVRVPVKAQEADTNTSASLIMVPTTSRRMVATTIMLHQDRMTSLTVDDPQYWVELNKHHPSRAQVLLPVHPKPWFDHWLERRWLDLLNTEGDRAYMRVYIGVLKGIEAGVWVFDGEMSAGAYVELGLESVRLGDRLEGENYLKIAKRKLKPGRDLDYVSAYLRELEALAASEDPKSE